MQKENEETSIPIQGMPLPPYMYTGPFTRREGCGQRGRGEDIQNKEEILQLLEAVWEPSQIAVIRCRGHQRGPDHVIRGNCMADQAAREAAEKQSSPGEPGWAAKFLLPPLLPPIPDYTKEEELWAKNEGGIKGEGGWWKLADQRFLSQVL